MAKKATPEGVREIKAAVTAPVTIQVDLNQILTTHSFTGDDCFEVGDEGQFYRVPARLEDVVANSIASQLKSEVTEWVKGAVLEETKSYARTLVKQFFDGEITMTNSYGQKQKSLPLKEFIAENIQEFINEKVNSRGEVDRYSREGTPRINYLIRKKVEQEIGLSADRKVNEVIEAAMVSVEEVVSTELSKKITKKLASKY